MRNSMLLITLIFVFSMNAQHSYAQDGRAADILAERIIKTLQKLDTNDSRTYKELMVNMKQVEQFIDQMTLSENQKAMIIEAIHEQDINIRQEENFRRLVREIGETGVNLKNIEYEEFLYKLRIDEGIKELKGDIYFKDGDEHYEMRVQAGLMDGEFILLEFRNLDVSYELHGYPEGFDPYEGLMVEEYMGEEYEEEVEELTPEQEQMIQDLERDLEESMHEEAIDDENTQVYVPVPPPVVIEEPVSVEEEIVNFPSVNAEFPGGEKAMQEFFKDNLLYPQEAMDMAEQGKVYVSFVVEPDGSITNVKIERGVSRSLDREAKRLIRAMPKWTPGESGGKKVRTRVMLPVIFSIT